MSQSRGWVEEPGPGLFKMPGVILKFIKKQINGVIYL